MRGTNHLSRFLPDHHRRRVGVAADQRGKDRDIGDAQSCDAFDPELRIEPRRAGRCPAPSCRCPTVVLGVARLRISHSIPAICHMRTDKASCRGSGRTVHIDDALLQLAAFSSARNRVLDNSSGRSRASAGSLLFRPTVPRLQGRNTSTWQEMPSPMAACAHGRPRQQ